MARNNEGMTPIVKSITRLTVGLILIYAFYVVFQGHRGPGGGFAGGVIIALSFMHLILAFGKRALLDKFNSRKCLLLAGFGALLYLGLTAWGFFTGAVLSFALFPATDIVAALMVAAGLFSMFLALIYLISNQTEK